MKVCCRLVATFGNNSGETAGGTSHSPARGAAGRDTSPQLMSSVGWGGTFRTGPMITRPISKDQLYSHCFLKYHMKSFQLREILQNCK